MRRRPNTHTLRDATTLPLPDALALVDIRVLDHPVVTGDAIVSFAERRLL